MKVVVSGSFHRHLSEIQAVVAELDEAGHSVLSPSDPRIVDNFGDFLYVASDKVRSIRMVQDRHLESIRNADFVWLVAPDGYVGPSASLELGFALGSGVGVFSADVLNDLTLRQYVVLVPHLRWALTVTRPQTRSASLLIDPTSVVESVHKNLDSISAVLRQPAAKIDESAARFVRRERRRIRQVIEEPGALRLID